MLMLISVGLVVALLLQLAANLGVVWGVVVANQQTAVSGSSPVLTVKGTSMPVQTSAALFPGGGLSSWLPDAEFSALHSVAADGFAVQVTGWLRVNLDTVFLLTSNAAIPFLKLDGASLTAVTDFTAASTTPVGQAAWTVASVMSPPQPTAAGGRRLQMAGTTTPTVQYVSYSSTASTSTGIVYNSTQCAQTTNGCPLPGYNASYGQCTRCSVDANCHATHRCDTCQFRCVPLNISSAQAPFASCLCAGGASTCSTLTNNVRLQAGAFPSIDTGCGSPAKQCVQCPWTYLL